MKTKVKKRARRAVDKTPPPSVAQPNPTDNLPSIDAYPPWRSALQACAYLQVSLPTIYRLMRSGDLETWGVGGRRRITTATIKFQMLPPSERVKVSKKKGFAPYQRLVSPPVRWPAKTAARASRRSA